VSYGEADRVVAKRFVEKVPALLALEAGSRFTEIDPRIAPLPHEPVLSKLFASAFFGTPLQSTLAAQNCDSVIVTGASTSGCVRATAVDVLQHGYRLTIPREAVGDRDPAAHEQALHDVDAKYGDVVSLDEALALITAS
jgi:nicotinamidase-related amidase